MSDFISFKCFDIRDVPDSKKGDFIISDPFTVWVRRAHIRSLTQVATQNRPRKDITTAVFIERSKGNIDALWIDEVHAEHIRAELDMPE